MWQKIRANASELIAIILALVGWVSVTYGVYMTLNHPAVLFISGGILAGGMAGWRVILALVADGIFATMEIDETEAGGSALGNEGERRSGRRSTLPPASL